MTQFFNSTLGFDEMEPLPSERGAMTRREVGLGG
jgi:hypothetical protein